MAPVRLLVLLFGSALAACGDGGSRRNIEMIPLPPPSATPEPVLTDTPAPAASAPPPSGTDSSSVPRALPRPASADPDPAPVTSSGSDEKAELQSALANTGWKLVGAIHTTREGAFEVHLAEVKKASIRGRVRLVTPHGEATTDDKVPYLPAGANPGTIVEVAAGKGAEAYYFDRARQTLGRVELKTPGDRREAGDLLRACFPFAR